MYRQSNSVYAPSLFCLRHSSCHRLDENYESTVNPGSQLTGCQRVLPAHAIELASDHALPVTSAGSEVVALSTLPIQQP